MKIIFLVLLWMISFHLAAQDQRKNSFGVSVGIGQPVTIQFIGSSSVSGNNFELGFNYYRQLAKKVKFESGIVWHRLQLTTPSSEPPFGHTHYDVGLVYVPLFIRLNFSKHFFFHGGFLADADLRTEQSIQNQSGLGAGMGFGFEVPISKKFIIQMIPYLYLHSILIANHDGFSDGLFDRGIKIGIRTR